MNSFSLTLSLNLRTRKKFLISSRSLELDPALDVPFVRLGYGDSARPYVPASTIKGVLRTSLMRVSELLGRQISVKSVEPSRLAEATPDAGDVVTTLFGRPSGPRGKLRFFPTMLDEKLYRLTHVRINDEIKTAERGGLYTAEYIPIGYDFKVMLEAVQLSVEEAEALFVAVAALPYERIGRAGLVDVKIDLASSRIPPELLEASPIIREVVEAMRV